MSRANARWPPERLFDRENDRARPELWTARSRHGVVTTAHYLATEAGVSALERGGNAVDAAVAASLALGVCEPAGSGLGGMSVMLVHLSAAKRTFVIEGACRAPHAATPEVLSASKSRYRGYGAVAIPTIVAVLQHALESYGRLRRSDVLTPAIRIADEGVPVTKLQQRMVHRYRQTLTDGNAGSLFFDRNALPRPVGYRLCQPALGKTLRRILEAGFEDFYRGDIARRIDEDMKANGGVLRARDLAGGNLFREAEPLAGRFRDRKICTTGPPAGGLTLLQMLQMASCAEPDELVLDTPRGACLAAGIIRRARGDRRKFRLLTAADGVGDAAELLDPDYAAEAMHRVVEYLDARAVAEELAPGTSAGSSEAGGEGETSHLCVMDGEGNVVASTQSIERSFGAGVQTPSLGFLYNGYLRAFKIQNRQHPHFLRPGAPARSNAAPAFLFDRSRPYAAIGNTGSERMPSGILGALLRLERESPFEAVHGPRLHCTPEGIVAIELERFSPSVGEALRRHGFELDALGPYAFQMGGLQLAVRQGDESCGVADPRRDGAAAGAGEPASRSAR